MKLAAWILQIFGGYLMLGCFSTIIYLIYMFPTLQIETGADIIAGILSLVIFIFITAYPGYRLFRKGRNMLKSPEYIKESNHGETNTIQKIKVSKDDKALINNLSGQAVVTETAVTFSQSRVVICKGCGANNIIESNKAKCEYCGGYLT